MNIAALSNLQDLGKLNSASASSSTSKSNNSTFDSMYQAAVNLVKDTNSYSDAAKEAETSYALGKTDSTHELMVAQQKANLALQYTVAIRNNVMDAYKEIMNMQF